MGLRKLSEDEIEAFIDEDKIIQVGCREPQLTPMHGKFVKGKGSLKTYSFCPFKKGVNLPFLEASAWLLKDDSDEGHKATMEETLQAAFRDRKGRP